MEAQNKIPVLEDTVLFAIFRDEKMNAAGGIEDYCHCTLPFVESAIVADTGSIDGTREVLEEMKGIYGDKLTILDHEFDGFAESRNFLFTYAWRNNKMKKYSLFTDADERISVPGFQAIKEWIQEEPERKGYCLPIHNVSDEIVRGNGHNPRLVLNEAGNYFENASGLVYEKIYNKDKIEIRGFSAEGSKELFERIKLYHFLSPTSNNAKQDFYHFLECDTIRYPKEAEVYFGSKKLNPMRLNKKFQKILGLPDYELSIPEGGKK